MYLTYFLFRSDAGDSGGSDKLYKEASKFREPYKPVLAGIVEKALGNSMSDDILNNLLERSDILKELFAMVSSAGNNDRAGEMSAHYNLLTYLRKAR